MKVRQKEIVNANLLTVTIGSTGFMGGDAGHGGRTFFEIKDDACTCISAEIDGIEIDNFSKIKICLGGDSELETFIDALFFAARSLKEIAGE